MGKQIIFPAMEKRPTHNRTLTRTDNAQKYGEARQPSDWEESREETLGAFLGEERCAEVFADMRPDPLSVGTFVTAWLKDQKPEEVSLQDTLIEHWAEVVGKDNAAHCKLLLIEEDTAVLEVDNALFRYALNQNKALLEKRLSEFTAGAVKQIRFTLVGASWSRHSGKGQK